MAIIQYGGIRIDVQADTKGVRAMRTDIAALTRMVNESSGPAGKFERDLIRIAKVSEDGAASQEFLKKATDAAINKFLAAAAAQGKYLQALQHVAAVIPAAAERMKQLEIQYLRQQKAVEDTARAEEEATRQQEEHLRAIRFAQSIIDQYSTKEEKRAAVIRDLNADLKAGLITQEQYNRAVAAANRIQSKTVEQRSLAKEFGGGILSGISPMGAVTAGAAGFMAGQKTIDFAKDSVGAYMDMRQALVKLEVTLGSAGRALIAFNELREIAIASNQTTDAINRSAVTMAQFGVQNNQLIPVMSRLSEISAGNAEKLQSLAIAYGQVAAAGRLTGQETLQFVNAGFNPLAEISRTTGRSMAELRKEMELGAISLDMVTGALISATDAGGRFYGMNDKMAGELIGKVNRLTTEFTKLKEELGSLAESAGLEHITYLVRQMTGDIKYLKEGSGFGPILTSLFEGTEMGATMGTQTPWEIEQYKATGMTQRERDAKRQAEIEDMIEAEQQALKRQQETVGRTIYEGFQKATESFGLASTKYAEGISIAAATAKKLAEDGQLAAAQARQQRIRSLIDQRADLLGKNDKENQMVSSDLPKAVSMGTREAYELVTRTQSTMQAKQLEEQRKQRLAQELTNKILLESKKQNIMGILN